MEIYTNILQSINRGEKLLAVLIDPEKFLLNETFATSYLHKIPSITTHLFIGGSTDPEDKTQEVVLLLKKLTSLPILLFPGSHHQVTAAADGILFLSLLSGRNPEYLVGEQVKSSRAIFNSRLEVIPTGYILIDGGSETAVQRVSGTKPISQHCKEEIINTALAAMYMGNKVIYLEAGSGAKNAVDESVISAVKAHIAIPLIIGGGIRSKMALERAFEAGADLVVVGTAFETGEWA